MIKIAKVISYILILISTAAYGQMDSYEYKRELSGVTDRWHSVELPQDVMEEMKNDLSDVRIYGIINKSDTLEVPYLLNVLATKDIEKKVGFGMLNFSKNSEGYFYTFQIDNADLINQISLNFHKTNFDWRIKLEGSQDQKEWFTILDDYRILNINSGDTKFNFTELNFPDSRYEFYRIFVMSKSDPKFESASISRQEMQPGKIKSYSTSISDKSKTSDRTSVYELALDESVRINSISISVNSDFEFYRPITIVMRTDSVQTEVGMKYSYQTLTTGILNSFEPASFSFPAVTTARLKILIENGDNQALEIGDITANGFEHVLIARFTEQEAAYYLVYGNSKNREAQYDIARFTDSIPSHLTALSLGNTAFISEKDHKTSLTLFENQRWLWAVLVIIIALLAWFSLKMMRAKTNSN